jgi:hypothetical protein
MGAGKARRGSPKAGCLNSGMGGLDADRRRLPLRLRDYIQIVNSVLFLVLGLVILLRVVQVRLTGSAILIGGGLFLFGIYRLHLIRQYFQRKE